MAGLSSTSNTTTSTSSSSRETALYAPASAPGSAPQGASQHAPAAPPLVSTALASPGALSARFGLRPRFQHFSLVLDWLISEGFSLSVLNCYRGEASMTSVPTLPATTAAR